MAGVVVNGYLGFIFFFLVLLCVLMVYYYAEPGFPWHTYGTLVIGYYAAFGILLLVPIDIASCILDRRSNAVGNYAPYDDTVNNLSSAYDTFFTLVLIMGSVVLVFEEYYNTDGYFGVLSKLGSAFYRMTVDTVVGMIGGLIVLGILIKQNIVGQNSDALLLAAVIVTNTVYEMFLVFLLAYGLVEFPRRLWNIANLDYHLLLTQMDATADYKAISNYKVDIQEDISKIHYFKNVVGAGDPKLVHAIQVLQSDCPPEFKSKRKANAEDVKKYVTKTGQVTLSGLAALRTDLKVSKNKYKMAQVKVQTTQLKAYELEDIIAARASGKSVIHWSLKNKDSTPFEYNWHIKYKPILYRIGAVMFAFLSIFSFLGAISSMHGVDPQQSVYFQAIHSSSVSGGGIVVFIFITLGYAAYVTMWALFQMQFAGMMVLVPYSTSPQGLSFNVRMVARLAAPLVFFYLGWVAEAGLKQGPWTSNDAPTIIELVNVTYSNVTVINNTTSIISNYTVLQNQTISQSIFMPSSFSNFYQLQKVHIIDATFGTLFPVVLIILVPLFATNIFNRLLVLVKMDSWQFGTPIPTEEQLRDGKRQLAKYRKLAERGEQRGILSAHLRKKKVSEAGIFGFLFKAGKDEEENLGAKGDEGGDIESPPAVVEPDALSGTFEKKGSAHLGMGAKWKEVFGEVRSPGILYIFKDAASASAAFANTRESSALDPVCLANVDLRLVISFVSPPKKAGKDTYQLELELAEETIKLRFKTLEEQERWKNLLLDWKDFSNESVDASLSDVVSPMASSAASAPAIAKEAPKEAVVKRAPPPSTRKAKTAAATAATDLELDSIMVDDNGDVVSSAVATKPNSKTTFVPESRFVEPASVDDDEKPLALEGWLDKKGHGKMMSNDWAKRYCRIVESTSSFSYYKTNNPKEAPLGSLDLRQVVDISSYDKTGKSDPARFNIDMGEKVYKFKAVTATEGERWMKSLNDWKEYFLMHTDH